MPAFADQRVFLREFFRTFQSTGALLPSGRALSCALARHIRPGERPQRVLEVGPGTGAVTCQIARALGPEDTFHLVELNEAFVRHLEGRFAREAIFQAVAPRSRIIHGRLEELDEPEPYDVIVSCLPLNNFPVSAVTDILAIFAERLRPGGTLSFFEYMAVRSAKSLVARRKERERLRGISLALDKLFDHHRIRCEWIWPNVPPAWVHHIRFAADGNGAPAAEGIVAG